MAKLNEILAKKTGGAVFHIAPGRGELNVASVIHVAKRHERLYLFDQKGAGYSMDQTWNNDNWDGHPARQSNDEITYCIIPSDALLEGL